MSRLRMLCEILWNGPAQFERQVRANTLAIRGLRTLALQYTGPCAQHASTIFADLCKELGI